MLAVWMVNVKLRAGRELRAGHPQPCRDPLLSRALRGKVHSLSPSRGT